MESIGALRRYIQTHLDEDLSLARLAVRAGLSPFQLHRRFTTRTGITPARYVERCRLHNAAHALVVEDGRLLDVALRHGYRNQETFSRAFRRRFGCTPSRFRRASRWAGNAAPPVRASIGSSHAISCTRPQRLRRLSLACLRHIGDYRSITDEPWRDLTAWLAARDVRWGAFLGIGYDDPQATGSPRFDAAVVVPRRFPSGDRVIYRETSPCLVAVTSHVGPYATLPAALPEIYAQTRELPGYASIGLPLIEMYLSDVLVPDAEIHHTEVYVPIRPTGPVEMTGE